MKINKLSFGIASLGLIAMLILSACNAAAPAASNTDLPPIRLGNNQWIGNGAIDIADAKGFFAKEGVKVQIVNYDSVNAGNTAFASRQVEANSTVFSDAIAQASAKVPLQVVWLFDTSQGGDVVVGNNSIKSPADLKGKRIGLSYGTFGHVFVLSGLAKYGLTRDDVTLVNVAGEDVPQALADGKIDAGHTWEPFLSTAVKNGNHPIFTSADTPGIIQTALEFQTDTIQKRPQDVQAVLRALQDALEYWNSNPDDANQIVAKAISVAPGDIPGYLQTDHIYTIAEGQAIFDTTNPQSGTTILKTISDFFVKEKVIPQAPDASVLNGTFALALSAKKQ